MLGGYTAAQRMPARRPYASRGVARRVTSYARGGRPRTQRISATGSAALAAVLALIVGGVVLVAGPAVLGLPASLIPGSALTRAAGGANAPVPIDLAGGKGGSGLESVVHLQAVPVPGSTQLTSDGLLAASPTQRRWETAAPGLVIDAALVARLDEALVGVDGHVSVAVEDLASGRGAALDPHREMPSASLYKLAVLYSVFEAGLPMGEELAITDEARSYDAGTLELGVGETLSVAEALERMVTISDNTAAVMLGSRVGSSRVNADLAALGMDTTHYSLERMTTSAFDMLQLLDALASGKAVSPAASAEMVHLLLRQRVNDRLPRLLPGDVEVAHKTGNLPGTVNDVGILFGPSSSVAVAALISETTDEAAAATAIARLAQTAYLYFAAEPEVAGRPTIPRAPARAIPPVWRQPRPVPPTPTLEPTSVAGPTPSAQPELAQPTPYNTPAPPPPAASMATPTVAARVMATQPPPTPTPAARTAAPAPTAPPQPTHAPTARAGATATPLGRR